MNCKINKKRCRQNSQRKVVRTREAKGKMGFNRGDVQYPIKENGSRGFSAISSLWKTSTPIHIGNGANIRTEGKKRCALTWVSHVGSSNEGFLDKLGHIYLLGHKPRRLIIRRTLQSHRGSWIQLYFDVLKQTIF